MTVPENDIHYLEIVTPDAQSSFQNAVELGATVALEPTEIPGRGIIAIFLYGGIEQGLWQIS